MADNVNLVTLRDPQSPVAEAYRALRMNLAFTSLDRALESFVVSSQPSRVRRPIQPPISAWSLCKPDNACVSWTPISAGQACTRSSMYPRNPD